MAFAAPDWQGARSEAYRGMRPTSNAVGRDAAEARWQFNNDQCPERTGQSHALLHCHFRTIQGANPAGAGAAKGAKMLDIGTWKGYTFKHLLRRFSAADFTEKYSDTGEKPKVHPGGLFGPCNQL